MVNTQIKNNLGCNIGVIMLPWPPKELSPNARSRGWQTRYRVGMKYRHNCGFLVLASKVKPGAERPVRLRVEFCPPRRGGDIDNMVASAKSLMDGLADAWKVNDKDFAPEWSVGEPVRGGSVRVEIVGEGV